jgi:hypothetical protein
MPLTNLVALYLNWRNRFIPAEQRRVFRSVQFGANPAYAKHKADINRLLGKIAAGADLTPHLSDRIGTAYEVNRKGSLKGAALDLTLNEWNIHHLHFGHEIAAGSRFVKRCWGKPELLFAIFRPGAAYVLDVLTHDDFTNDELVRIAVRNWRDRGLFLRVNGLPGPQRCVTPKDRGAARSKRGNVLVEVDGEFYVAPDAISQAGVSMNTVRGGDLLRDNLDAYSGNEDVLVAHMRADPENIGRRIPDCPSFELVEAPAERGYGFGIRERACGALLWMT